MVRQIASTFARSADFTIADNVFARIAGVSKRQDGHVKRMDYGCMNPTSGVPILEGVGQDCVVGTMGDVNYTALRASCAGLPATRWN